MSVQGQLASDQTFVVLAMRCWLYFRGTNDEANYLLTASQLYFTLVLGDKPQFSAPAWYFPAGGGIWAAGGSDTMVYNNGNPQGQAIAKLARPVVLPVRQNFYVNAEFFTVGATNALTLLNAGAGDDEKVIMFAVDGLQTRDVQ